MKFPSWPEPNPVFSRRNMRLWPLLLLLFIGAVIVVFRAPDLPPEQATDVLAVDTAGVPRDEAVRQASERRARVAAQQSDMAAVVQPVVTLPPLAPAPRPIAAERDHSYGSFDAEAPRGVQTASDPIQSDLQRRRYEARFASNVTGQSIGPGAPPLRGVGGTADDDDDTPAGTPSLQDIANAVVRANGGIPTLPPSASPVPPAAPDAQPVKAAPAVLPPPPPAQVGLHRVLAGTVIEAVLEHQFVTNGPTRCVVSTDVYSHDLTLVLPRGSKVLGDAQTGGDSGEPRVAVTFDIVQRPDGTEFSIPKFAGLNQEGGLGLKGKVDNHLWSSLAIAGAFGLVQGFSQYVASGMGHANNGGVTIIAGDITGATSQVTAQAMQRYLNRPPKVTLSPGHRVHVYLRSNLDLPAWSIQ